MIVYVESNFVVEMALGQEQAPAADAILDLATRRLINLAIPSFALSEPYATVKYHAVLRRELSQSFDRHLRELGRSKAHEDVVSLGRQAYEALQAVEKLELDRLQAVVGRLLRVARTLNLDDGTFERAISYEMQHGFSPQDAIVYATIMADLQAQPAQEAKLFSSRDKAFLAPSVRDELRTFGCRYVGRFDHAIEAINHELGLGED